MAALRELRRKSRQSVLQARLYPVLGVASNVLIWGVLPLEALKQTGAPCGAPGGGRLLRGGRSPQLLRHNSSFN